MAKLSQLEVKFSIEDPGRVELEFEPSCYATKCPFCETPIIEGAIHLCGQPSRVVLHPSFLIAHSRISDGTYRPHLPSIAYFGL